MDLSWLSAVPIETVPVLALSYLFALVPAVVLLLPTVGLRHDGWARRGWTALAAGLGALAGWILVWQLADVQDVFGAPASDVIRGAASSAGALCGLGIANLIRSRMWRKAVAGTAIVAAIAAAGLAINRDVAYYPHFGDVFGDTGVGRLAIDRHPTAPRADTKPATGRLGTVRIPGTVSGFRARDAWVYLPPAALTGKNVKLPVLIAMSGEPGGPSDVFIAGGLKNDLDTIAAQHHGVAPIVVVPDQLGSYDHNPMCVDSKIGRVATYITVDVRKWALAHLPAARERSKWSVAGFSQGGTCAAQFGARYPDQFGSFIAVSPEWGPLDHSPARTIAEAFRGDRTAWQAAFPIAIMRAHRHYLATNAVFAVGALDHRYGKVAPAMAAESSRVGIRTTFTRLPGLAHNWNTGAAGLDLGIRTLLPNWGIR